MYSRKQIKESFKSLIDEAVIDEQLDALDNELKTTVVAEKINQKRHLIGNTIPIKAFLKENGYTWKPSIQSWTCTEGVWKLSKPYLTKECKTNNLNLIDPEE